MGSLVGIRVRGQDQSPPILKPPRLKPGDRVGLIAPGSPVPADRIAKAEETTRLLGYQPVLGQYVFEKNGYLAGTDEQRLQDLHDMFQRPDIKAIWCIRGGYGCTRLLSRINYDEIKANPKIFIGFSDITALHLAIHEMTGLVTFHGPVAASAPTEYSIESLRTILTAPQETTIQAYKAEAHSYPKPYPIRPGESEGILTGGNLSLLAALAGTPWSPSYENKIVFIEDIGEKPYRIDRMLVQLSQATDLPKAAGIILGIFHDCEAKQGENSLTLEETLRHNFAPLNVPVAFGCSFGHVDHQCTFPLGIRARMDAAKNLITILESATS